MNQSELLEAVTQKVKNYAVLMMTGDSILGSGTLSSFAGSNGILTAWHVFYDKHNLRKPFSVDKTVKLSVGHVTDIPHNTEFEFQHLDLRGTDSWANEEWGPDLLFITLPESSQLQSLRARKSFFPLDHDTDTKIEKATKKENCIWCFVGYPEVLKRELTKSHGFDTVFAVPGMVSFGGPNNAHARDEWDYLDIPVEYQDSEMPSSFGGVSGGGYWKLPLLFEDDNVVEVGDPLLIGVAYFEANRMGPDRFLRCHGPRSVYIKLGAILGRSRIGIRP